MEQSKIIDTLETYHAFGPYEYMLDVPSLSYVICYVSNLVLVLIWIKLNQKLVNFLTLTGFVVALKLSPFLE